MSENPAKTFRDSLHEILTEYPTPDGIGEGTDFETASGDHPLYKLVVHQAGGALSQLIDPSKYKIKASVGRGSPTYIPFIAVMQRDETTSPQKGRYVVYLFDPIKRTLYLTLNQGAKEATEKASESDFSKLDILRDRARAMAHEVDLDGFTNERLQFDGQLGSKSGPYGAGTVCYRAYQLDDFPDAETILDDLNRLLSVYDEIITEPLKEVADGGQQRTLTSTIPEYDELEVAIDDIQTRLNQSANTTNWVRDQLSATILRDWSSTLSGFKPSDTVSPSDGAKLDQIRALYQETESTLESKVNDLGSGELNNLSQVETLFFGLLRLAQIEAGIETGKISQPRLNSILKNSYTITNSTTEDESTTTKTPNSDHPLITHLQDTTPSVYKVTSPPDYWLTAYEHAAVGLEDDDQHHWSDIEAGDVLIFHSREKPSRNELTDQESCILGAGIVRAKTTKPEDEAWWHDEHNTGTDGKRLSNLITFDRLYLTGNFDAIDHTQPLRRKHPRRSTPTSKHSPQMHSISRRQTESVTKPLEVASPAIARLNLSRQPTTMLKHSR